MVLDWLVLMSEEISNSFIHRDQDDHTRPDKIDQVQDGKIHPDEFNCQPEYQNDPDCH